MKPICDTHPTSRFGRYVAPCLLLLLGLAFGQGSAFAQATSGQLLTTFTNPAPTTYPGFSIAVAALATDRVVIAAGGAAYLFSTKGTLLSTLTNPAPSAESSFGSSLAVFGPNRVVIGDQDASVGAVNTGAAYLFNTNGGLVLTLNNPTPQDFASFGYTVAGFGSDRFLVSAHKENAGATQSGAAYLFNTNGAVLTKFTNPSPAAFALFGQSFAVGGTDRVLIGARNNAVGGVAYLFSTNGILLTTFTNPIPQTGGSFGGQMAAVGTDRLLISDILADTGGINDNGAAYLFNTNGTLLTTFTNPLPVADGYFGISVAAVGNDRVLIGANLDNVLARQVGAAFLFNTNGTLLNTFTNATPTGDDEFGYTITSVGSDQVLIGAYNDQIGGIRTGSAYLYALPYPQLGLTRNGAAVSLKWVSAETGLVLQQAGALGSPTVWSNSTDTVSVTGLTNLVQQTIGPTNRFFRLRRP